MKKAYVKPVFLAEEFVAETSYASGPCGVSIWSALKLKETDCFCGSHSDNGCNHQINFKKGGSWRAV